MVHINNGMKNEVDRALDLLLTLLEHHCKVMLQFTPLVKVSTGLCCGLTAAAGNGGWPPQ